MNNDVEKKQSEKKFFGKYTARQLGEKAFDFLCILSGAFFAGVYLPYFFWHAYKGHLMDVAVSLLVFLFVSVPFLFRKKWKKLLKKGYLPLKIIWCVAMCFYMITFLVFFIRINNHGDIPPEDTDKQQIVLVFGCEVHEDGTASSQLGCRIREAAKILLKYPSAVCVASGGKGPEEGAGEGETIKRYLIERYGIEESRILVEGKSTDTAENVRFSLDLLRENGYTPEECAFICVSSAFHTPRARLLLERSGVTDCATVSSETVNSTLLFIFTVREYMSYVYMWIFG